MADFFRISDADMLNPMKIKIICGIAGSAKSSNIHKFFTEKGLKYTRYTSTNKLKRDAVERYGCACETIASGLFITDHDRCKFYAEEKDVSCENVVIDEVLQAGEPALKWIDQHRGLNNIIVTTDDRQMLNPFSGEQTIKTFRELLNKPYVIYSELQRTFRARDSKTAEYYYTCYKSVSEYENILAKDYSRFSCIPYEQLKYNTCDVFICHTNEIENMLYKDFDLYHSYVSDLIPKGNISRRNVEKIDLEKYPILPQLKVSRNTPGYLQIANVGTPTRYQGSEVTNRQKLYFLTDSFNTVNNREWYTVVTRSWLIENIVLVDCRNALNKQSGELIFYNNKPVKRTEWKWIDGSEFALKDGTTLKDFCENSGDKKVRIPDDEMNRLLDSIKDTDEVHYNTNAVFVGESDIMVLREMAETDIEIPPRGAPSMMDLLAREPDFAFEYMPEFYKAWEKAQISRYKGAKCTHDILATPCLLDIDRKAEIPFPDELDYMNIKTKQEYSYCLDFKSSYPYILYLSKLPTAQFFKPRPDGLMDNEFHTQINTPNCIDWYIGYCDLIPEGVLCTGELVRFIQENITAWAEFIYVGTSSAKVSSDMGKRLYTMANLTKESKAAIKFCKYGIADRAYLERIDFTDGENFSAYAYNKNLNHQLLMAAIRSTQCLNLLKIKKFLYGDLKKGATNADALYFDTTRRIKKLGEEIRAVIPGYDFRILKNKGSKTHKGEILYQSYADLPTAAEFKKLNRKKSDIR